MKVYKGFAILLALTPCLGAVGSSHPLTLICPPHNPTVCSPNGGVFSGPFYNCSDDGTDCCWKKDVYYNCGAPPGPYTVTPYQYRFPAYGAICDWTTTPVSCKYGPPQ
jgi:hypothetical protein